VRFGDAMIDSLRHPPANLGELARKASDRVRRELDWRAISRRAVDRVEQIARSQGVLKT
jgi:hypothetical protein